MPPAPEKPRRKEPVGPVVGVVIILILMLLGAVYFWQAERAPRGNAIPYIPPNSSTTTAQ